MGAGAAFNGVDVESVTTTVDGTVQPCSAMATTQSKWMRRIDDSELSDGCLT
jgi:hypothetical protein